MTYSPLYKKTLDNPIQNSVKGKPEEVAYKLVQNHSENGHIILFFLENGRYKIDTGCEALSNYGFCRNTKENYEQAARFAADRGDWDEVLRLTNSGYGLVFDIDTLYMPTEEENEEDSFVSQFSDLESRIIEHIEVKMNDVRELNVDDLSIINKGGESIMALIFVHGRAVAINHEEYQFNLDTIELGDLAKLADL
tara:strand:+ start:63518 stop:64102 length:585 start_codon:yes stop_codon:yes gene_type:complete